MQLRLQTLTPLWCGGVDPRNLDRIHETGLVGSIRWWYEAVIRGLGGYACDPSRHESSSCSFNIKKYEGSSAVSERDRLRDADLCYVCQLFGAQGYGGRFRVYLSGGRALFPSDRPAAVPLPRRIRKAKAGWQLGGWYLNTDSRISTEDNLIHLSLIPMASENDLFLTHVPLTLAYKNAALGAKTSQGYGVMDVTEVVNETRHKPLEVNETLVNGIPSEDNPPGGLPDLREFFFAKFAFGEPKNNPTWWQNIRCIREAWTGEIGISQTKQPYRVHKTNEDFQRAKNCLQTSVACGILPLAPAVRNWLRFEWPKSLGDGEKNLLFGNAQKLCPICYSSGLHEDEEDKHKNRCLACNSLSRKEDAIERMGSKVQVSHAYRRQDGFWEFRVWGWIPLHLFNNDARKRKLFLGNLKATLTDIKVWNWIALGNAGSPSLVEWHDVEQANGDGRLYLKQLLGLEKGGTA